jgi:hypothetical protein
VIVIFAGRVALVHITGPPVAPGKFGVVTALIAGDKVGGSVSIPTPAVAKAVIGTIGVSR